MLNNPYLTVLRINGDWINMYRISINLLISVDA